MLAFCALIATCLGLWRWHMKWVDSQCDLAAQITRRDGNVTWETWGPSWIHASFDSRYFQSIVAVEWHSVNNQDLELLCDIPTLNKLDIG